MTGCPIIKSDELSTTKSYRFYLHLVVRAQKLKERKGKNMKHQGNIKQDEIGAILIFLIPLGLAVVSSLIYGIGASINVLSSNQNIAIPA